MDQVPMFLSSFFLVTVSSMAAEEKLFHVFIRTPPPVALFHAFLLCMFFPTEARPTGAQ